MSTTVNHSGISRFQSSAWGCCPDTPLALIADPDDPRTGFYRKASKAFGLPEPEVISYLELLAEPAMLKTRVEPGSLIRIESPGRSMDILRGILKRGYPRVSAESGAGVSPIAVDQLSHRKGIILNTRQWYHGFCEVLNDVEQACGGGDGACFTSHPDDIRTLFDKVVCHKRLASAGIPVPLSLGQPGCFEELISLMKQRRCFRVFVKLRHGSAASGIVALETSRGRIQAWTTVEAEVVSGSLQLFNSRRIRRIRDHIEVAAIIDALCLQGVQVERWVPKAGTGDKRFDLRILIVSGQPAHTVVRLSDTAITNLHLGNRRAGFESVRHRVDEENWNAVLQTCRCVGSLFSRSLHVAVDLAISSCGRKHWVLEANAFGDFLRDCRFADLDPYELQVAILSGRNVEVNLVQGCVV